MKRAGTGPDAKAFALVVWLGVWLGLGVALSLPAFAERASATLEQAIPLPPGHPDRFADAMARFAETPVPDDAVLLVGSSSIRLWPDPEHAFGPGPVIARGFGGAHLADVWTLRGILFPTAAPTSLILYAGENDLAAGVPPPILIDGMRRLVAHLTTRWPDTPILLLGVKPSPARSHRIAAFAEADHGLAALAETVPMVTFLPTAPLLGSHDAPDPAFYAPDRLHLSPAGYAIWEAAIQDWLRDVRG